MPGTTVPQNYSQWINYERSQPGFSAGSTPLSYGAYQSWQKTQQQPAMAAASGAPAQPTVTSPWANMSNDMENAWMTTQQKQQAMGFTGVSTATDPYGLTGLGLNLDPKIFNKQMLGNMNVPFMGNSNLGPGASAFMLNPNDASAPGTSPSDSNWANQQTGQGPQTNAVAQGGYPAYPNAYGLGSSPPGAAAPAGGIPSSYSPQSITVNTPDATDRGFNPWSMEGEANARDSSKGVMSPSTQTNPL